MCVYVLVNASAGKVRELTRRVADLLGVRMDNARWGVPDILVLVEVENADELNKLVIDKIQSLEGVVRTETHIGTE